MDIAEVKKRIKQSLSHNLPDYTSVPIISMLNLTKTEKKRALFNVYDQFIKNNQQSVVLINLSSSSFLFSWLQLHAGEICYWRQRIFIGKKRVDLLVASFSHTKLLFV